MNLDSRRSAILILRFGLVFVFLFVAVATFINPSAYVHFVPKLITQLIPVNSFLFMYACFEIFLVVWLISGIKSLYAAAFAAVTLFLITIFNFSDFGVLFRNVAIFCSALALAFLSSDK